MTFRCAHLEDLERIKYIESLPKSLEANDFGMITSRQIQLILAKLKAERKIIRHGANKKGYWEVKGKLPKKP